MELSDLPEAFCRHQSLSLAVCNQAQIARQPYGDATFRAAPCCAGLGGVASCRRVPVVPGRAISCVVAFA